MCSIPFGNFSKNVLVSRKKLPHLTVLKLFAGLLRRSSAGGFSARNARGFLCGV